MAPLTPGLLLVAALLAAPGAGPAFDPRLSEEELVERRLQENDPAAAAACLGDKRLQEALRARDPDRLARMMLRAVELKDLQDVLLLHEAQASLHEALRTRLDDDELDPSAPARLGFGSRPARLASWAHDRLGLDGYRLRTLRGALLEWDSLPPRAQTWLGRKGAAKDEWAGRSFRRRAREFQDWGLSVYDGLMARNPRTQAHVSRMHSEAAVAWDALPSDKRFLLDDRLTQAELVVEQVESLAADPKVLSDPALKGLLEEAGRSLSLEATLSRLSAIFDKLGTANRGVEVHRPPREEEKFTDADRQRTAALLAGALLKSIGSTEPGRRVQALYKTQKLVLRIRPLESNLAEFQPETRELTFNENYLMQWLQTTRRRPPDLARPEVLQELVMLLEPTFVHEAIHHEQSAWADARGIEDVYHQYQEIEAKGLEALHILQKSRAEPKFRSFLRDNQDLLLVKEYVGLSNSLESDPRAFPGRIAVDYYPSTASLEGATADQLRWHERLLGEAGAEERRRAALPAPDRAKLDAGTGRTIPAGDRGSDAWRSALREAGAAELAKERAALRESRDRALRAYELGRERYLGIMALVDKGVSNLPSIPSPASGPTPPPPPEKGS